MAWFLDIERKKYMKKNKLFAGVIMMAMVLFACKKDKDITPPPAKITETPGKTTIEAKTKVDTLVIGTPPNPSEIGTELFFSKKGKVTALGGLFATKGNFRVSFWEVNTKNLIVTVSINVTDTTKFTYVNIAPINVAATTGYIISINNTQDGISKNVYAAAKNPNFTTIYPFTVGSVTFVQSLAIESINPAFPNFALDDNVFIGISDFVFEPEQ
jgi:hypothetical protein